MNRIDGWIGVACDVLMWLGALAALLMMLHVAADVAGRYLFLAPLNGTLEIVANYYMVALTFLPIAWIARNEGHIIVELFTRKLSPSKLSKLEFATTLVTLVYVVVFAWMTAVSGVEETAKLEVREAADGFIPVWPSRWYLPIGLGMMAVFLAWRLVRTLWPSRD